MGMVADHSGDIKMRLPLACFALLLGCTVSGLPVHAQNLGSQTTNQTASANATEAEVNELRKEVAAQRQTIEQLQTMVGKLAEANTSNLQANAASLHVVTDSAAEAGAPQLVNAVMVQPDGNEIIVEQTPAAAPKKDAALTAGWNGEHFFIRSPDGQFSI
jgi:uncharacterized coiled-coil protein SlyX